MSPRIASSILVSALMRRAEGEGGFAVMIARGDPGAGAIVVILSERGEQTKVMERILQPDGAYRWQDSIGNPRANGEEVEKFLSRRRKFDPDIWIIELDVASAERFADEMNALD